MHRTTFSSILALCLIAPLTACRTNRGYGNSDAEHSAKNAVLSKGELGSTERVHEIGGFLLASQPTAPDLELARARGVQTVIDQRKPTEDRGFDELALVQSLGLAYLNPSFGKPEELSDALLDQTREHMRTAERPVLMHCASANRTGATWLAYRVLDEGVALEQALAEAKTVGLRSPEYESVVRAYIARSQATK